MGGLSNISMGSDDEDAGDSSCGPEEDEEAEGCLPLDSIDSNTLNSGQRHLSGRHGMPSAQAHLQRQSHRGAFMHKIARAQALENKVSGTGRTTSERGHCEIECHSC